MMPWLLPTLQYLHTLCGIFWMGGGLFSTIILIPTLQSISDDAQAQIKEPLAVRVTWVITPVAILTVLLGAVRGIAGPIRSAEVLFGTAYGWTWLAALVVGCILAGWGLGVITPVVRRLEGSPPGPETQRLIGRVKLLAGLELLGFAGILGCMVAMRFGY